MTSFARVLLLTGLGAAAAFAADPVLGTWKLDVQHSKFSSEPAVLSEVRTYVETSEGTKVTVKTVDGKGKETVIEYPVTFDGKDHVQPGTAPGTSVTLKKDSDYHASAVLMHAGNVIADVERIISDDGTTMTITYKGKNDSGDEMNKLMVYQRVATGKSQEQ